MLTLAARLGSPWGWHRETDLPISQQTTLSWMCMLLEPQYSHLQMGSLSLFHNPILLGQRMTMGTEYMKPFNVGYILSTLNGASKTKQKKKYCPPQPEMLQWKLSYNLI